MIRELAVICEKCNSVIWDSLCSCGAIAVKKSKITPKVLTIFTDGKVIEDFCLVTAWRVDNKVLELTRLPSINQVPLRFDKATEDVLSNL